ncbi:MAG TPA: XRE family transcriptional regulator [Planctomycetota bacterium]|nr:XRE family transcriptional regulator [Planctomycetota bacterium]
MIDIGLEIKILRERLQISAKELAERIGLSQSQISRLEKGQRRIDTRVLAKIADALGVEPSYFFGGDQAPADGVVPRTDPGGPGRHIRAQRRRLHVSAEDLASRLGITKAKLLSIEEGRRELEPELADKLCKQLRLPANFFLAHQQETIRRLEAQALRLEQALAESRLAQGTGTTRASAIPIIGRVARGYPTHFDAEGEPVGETDELLVLPDIGEIGAFALEIVGDSMEAPTPPSFREGDLVVCGRGPLRSRDFGFVRAQGIEPCIRQIFFESGGSVRLQPLNLNYPPSIIARDELLGMWRLVAHISRY